MTVENPIAAEACFMAYCAAIDARADAGAAARFYTDDGVMDNSALGSPLVAGRDALTATITAMFASMARLEHQISNFLVTGTTADTAHAQCSVQAFGQPHAGEAFSMSGQYAIAFRRVSGDWKMDRLTFSLFD